MLTTNQKANICLHLKENFHLPKSGFIAGQAVASLIYKELGLNINQPINDVDVFDLIDSNYDNFIKLSKHEKELGVLSNTGSNIDVVYYKARRSYEVKLSTYLKEDPNVNLIYISQNGCNEAIDKDLLLSSFDFNCCAVGYDIETGEFCWTKSFERI